MSIVVTETSHRRVWTVIFQNADGSQVERVPWPAHAFPEYHLSATRIEFEITARGGSDPYISQISCKARRILKSGAQSPKVLYPSLRTDQVPESLKMLWQLRDRELAEEDDGKRQLPGLDWHRLRTRRDQ